MTRLQAATIAALTLSTALPPVLWAQSQTVTDAAAAIQTFVVPTSAGAAYAVVPAGGVHVIGAASGRGTGATVAVALAVPAGWPSGPRTAGYLVTGADSVPLTVDVPERRSFALISKDAVIRRDKDSVAIGIRNSGNVALRVAADPVAHGGWRYRGGAWSVPAGQTLILSAVFRGRADGGSHSLSMLFRAEGTPTRAVPVRVEGGQRLVFPMAVGLGMTDGRPFLALEGAGHIAEGLRVDGAVSLGGLPVIRQLWSAAHRNYLSVQLPRFAAAIGEMPARSAEGLVWVPLGLGWALRAGGSESRTVEVALGWRDDFPRPAGGFSWHLRMVDRFAGGTQLAGSLFGIGGSTLLGFGDGLFGGAVRVSRATAAPWSMSIGAARVHDGLVPIGSFDARRELAGAAVAVWGRRDVSGAGWAAATSAGYGVEVKGHAGTRLLASGFLFRNDPGVAGLGVSGTAFTAALRSRPGASVGGGITGGAYAGSSGRRLSLEASGALRASRYVQAEAFYRVDGATESAWSGGVRVRMAGAAATGIVGVDYAQRTGDLHAGPRLFADLTGRTGDRLRWNLRTSAAGGRGGLVHHFDADLAAAFRISEGATVFGAVHRSAGDGGGSFSLGLQRSLDVGLPAAAPILQRAAEANGELEVTVRFAGDAGADAPQGAVSLTGPAGTIELPLDGRGHALAVGLPPGLYTVGHIPPANAGIRHPADAERVVVAPGGRAEVVIAAGYQRPAIRVNDLGGP